MKKSQLFSTLLACILGMSFAAQQKTSNQPPLSPEIQQTLAKKYPNFKLVKGCDGKFLGHGTSAIAVLRAEAGKKFLVLWVMSPVEIQELDTVGQAEPEFELQCMDVKEAKEREHGVHHTETIVGTLKVPKSQGAVCYFIDDTSAKCWALDRATGRLVEIGGWQT